MVRLGDDVAPPALGQRVFDVRESRVSVWIDGASWYEYGFGFLEGGKALLAAAENESDSMADRIAFPVLFLHRHYLELTLKTFIRDNAHRVGRCDDPGDEHGLRQLWRECRKIIECWWGDKYEGQVEALEDQLGQIHDVDPRSFAFRYPEKLSGEPSFQPQGEIDLRWFAERVEAIGFEIEAFDAGMHAEAEMREEARFAAAEYVGDHS